MKQQTNMHLNKQHFHMVAYQTVVNMSLQLKIKDNIRFSHSMCTLCCLFLHCVLRYIKHKSLTEKHKGLFNIWIAVSSETTVI